MKKILLICLLLISIGAFSQENEFWRQTTFKELAFSKPLNKEAIISQMSPESNKKRDLIPLIGNDENQLKQYLMNCYDEEGNVEETQYIISKQGIAPEFDLFLIPINTSNVLYFDGVLLDTRESDKDYKVYTIVKYQDQEVDMNTTLENYAVACGEGGSQICQHWYFIITVDGELVSIDDLGEICTPCSGGGGGGSGGGNGQPGNLTCEAYANLGTAISGSIDVSGGILNGDTWNIPYNWKIFSAGTWGLLSYEQASLKKVKYTNMKARWEYESFSHFKIAEAGATYGGTRTFQDLGATINITESKTSAWVRIDFSVTSISQNFPSICPPTTLPYNSNKTFIAPNNYVIGD